MAIVPTVAGEGAALPRASGAQDHRVPRVPRIPGIDGVRAIAILLVMSAHAGLGVIVPGGFGVTIFFFLSGYLIATLLRLEWRRTGKVDLRAFYARRAARIMPPLYLTLALVVVLVATGQAPGRLTVSGLVLDAVFLTNYARLLGTASTVSIPLWSLDVEQHYYLIFPALFGLLATRRSPVRALAIVCAIALAIRMVTFWAGAQGGIYVWSHTRFDSIMFGVILALWRNPVLDADAQAPRPWLVGLALAGIGATLVVRAPLFRDTVRYSIQGLALLVLFSAAIQARGLVARLLDSRPLRLVALLSYTLYLIHLPLLEAFASHWPVPWAILAAYSLAFAWSGLMYVAVELPLARWRKRSLSRAMRPAD